jgi:hypothetical protein
MQDSPTLDLTEPHFQAVPADQQSASAVPHKMEPKLIASAFNRHGLVNYAIT